MAKIIMGFSNRQALEKLSVPLERSGFNVLRKCLTGNEIMRAFSMCPDGILICGARFQDRTADQIAADLDERAMMLLIDRPERLAMCENPNAERLAMPFSATELVQTVERMVAQHDARMPRRTEEERAEVERAKEILMRERGFTEPEAHRFLQKKSMSMNVRLIEYARLINASAQNVSAPEKNIGSGSQL